MSKQLYPIKFAPILKSKIWGGNKLKTILNKNSNEDKLGESWELSGVEGDVSVVSNGFLEGNDLNEIIEIYMDDLVGEKVYQKFGTEFPLLLKFIDATQSCSIQVHPNDELAKERHDSLGKAEMWHVIDADPNSTLISGFKQKITKQEYINAFNADKLPDLLKEHSVSNGDTFFINTGNVHTIGAGILLAEVQQSSDVTYRIYDYNRTDSEGNKRELHTDFALDAIDYNCVNSKIDYETKNNQAVTLTKCEYFTTNIIEVSKTYERDIYSLNSFVAYMCMSGDAKITCSNGEAEIIIMGETVLIPASIFDIKISSDNNAKLLEIYIE